MGTCMVMTGEDLLRMPDGEHCELVRGEIVRRGVPGGRHGECVARLGGILDALAENTDTGLVAVSSGFYVARDPDTVRGPDVLFISKERLDPGTEVEGFFEVAPDLAVEIISPGDTHAEVMAKVGEYLDAGVRLVWVVDPAWHRISVYPGGEILSPEDTLTGGDVLPGFSTPVARVFQRRKAQ